MNLPIWPGWRLQLHLVSSKPRRCAFALATGGGPMRCIFDAGHPPHGHTLSSDLTAPPVKSPGLLPGDPRIA